MSVPSLEDIALYTSIRYIWEHSVLQPLTLKRVYTAQRKRYSYVADDVCRKKIDEIKDSILDTMMAYQYLPLRLRVKWVMAFECIYEDLRKWASEICCGQTILQQSKDLKIFKCCISKTIITQAGFIDRSNTILTVLKDSQFHIAFMPEFMIRNFVDEKALCNLGKQILEEISHRDAKVPRLEQDTSRDVTRALQSYNSAVSAWHSEIEYAVERARREDFNHYCAGKLALLAKLGEFAAVRQYIEQQRLLSQDTLQEQIVQAARFMIHQYCSDVEMKMILFDNLDPAYMNGLLEKYFVNNLFQLFLKSRRCRYLCLRWFPAVTHTLDPDSFQYMFRRASLAWVNRKYDYYDIIPILQRIWLEAPNRLKENESFIFMIIPKLFTAKFDVEMLSFFMNSFDLDRQKTLLAQIVICLFSHDKEDLIVECLETAPQLGLNETSYKIIIDTKFIRKLFLIWPIPIFNGLKSFKTHLKIIESIFHPCENIDTFKRELLADKEFMKKYLDEHWFNDTDEFLLWCHNEDATSVKVYTSQLLKEGIIQNVYEDVLIGIDEVLVADLGLDTLQIKNEEIESLKKNLMNKPKIKKAMLDKILNHDYLRMDVIKSEFSLYFNEKQEQESMERLFLCEEGRDAILSLLVPLLPKFDEDPSLRNPVSEFLLDFLYKKNILFTPYSLEDRIDEMLHNYGHPNLRNEQLYQVGGLFGVRNECEMRAARVWVDCVYRCVRALLRRDWTTEELQSAEQRDLTKLSLSLATQAALDIPVVL